MTDDPAMNRIPRCCAHESVIVAFLDKTREFRWMIENLVLAEAEADAGRIPAHELRTVQAKHDKVRNQWLKADERMRKGTC